MPGLTLNTDGATVSRTPIYPPAHLTSQPHTTTTTTTTTSTTTAAPTSAPTSAPTNPTPNPTTAASANTPMRSSSPQRPPYSPITPPLNPIAFPPRASYTHVSQQSQTSIAPPAASPIDFDTNPDVLALKSAISVLQLQRRKAETDMSVLSRVKTAALSEPRAFVRDLTEGRVGVEGDGRGDSDSESESDAEMGDADASTSAGNQHAPPTAEQPNQPSTDIKPDPIIKSEPTNTPTPRAKPQPRPWAKLPKPQNIVRCPPINWSQYAVVGESLEKLHAEQVSRPTQGVPAVVAADGRYEFSGATGRQERLVGIAAPYAPGKDRIDRRSKGPRR
ncbi:uncharacterized protein GGS22DRAFT_149665 [Annulohypoxylon maeteangense]|uniref:uncharacterized protein n=1 Tax=Annulohypoxylon maeteangense TaxID=1927788 RepID=UPI002008C725|nr:uncharacterized protein GGS22DRAFT_149665 [Annulohypoxylon maeteangense]KAI0889981.1 hypothetical protein GGS22DRAFT_149665 [Annulohypoxylon maeteangense]